MLPYRTTPELGGAQGGHQVMNDGSGRWVQVDELARFSANSISSIDGFWFDAPSYYKQ